MSRTGAAAERYRPRPRPSAAGGRAAVVLLHGYLCLSPRAYWRGVGSLCQALATVGANVVLAGLPRTGGVAERAARLAGRLDRLPQPRLVLVGHSMGGLDARYLASRLDPGRRVRAVVTVGTPHRGSAAAEWALGARSWPAPLLRLIDRAALRDLTRDGARRLDRAMPDRPDVAYRALLGRCPAEELAEPFATLARQIAEEEGDNDGVVSICSAARWPAPVVLPADHLQLIGQPLRCGFPWRVPPDRCLPDPLVGLLDKLAREREVTAVEW